MTSDIEGYGLTICGNGIVTDGRHAEGLTKATTEKDAKWWDTWQGQSLDGLIVPKSKTRFAPLWTDRYPTEKAQDPEGRAPLAIRFTSKGLLAVAAWPLPSFA